jgi:hypothetical protein
MVEFYGRVFPFLKKSLRGWGGGLRTGVEEGRMGGLQGEERVETVEL